MRAGRGGPGSWRVQARRGGVWFLGGAESGGLQGHGDCNRSKISPLQSQEQLMPLTAIALYLDSVPN